MRVDGAYYAFGTDMDGTGARVIGRLRSDDLVSWTPIEPALEHPPLPREESNQFWAPEVAQSDGRFFLYYSAGFEDTNHRIRLATSDNPAGPFRDEGIVLTSDVPFAIDPHPFRDDDGSWYLYYARDFLDGERAGTALVVDRLVDMRALAGSPTTALRASADWQIFRRSRPMYGAVYDWHTLEGPFVRKRDGRYYLFYSAGAWTEESYGVSYAVADSPLGPFVEPPEAADGPAILRTVPGRMLGPGHCSVTTGPDGGDWLVYHAWDPQRIARRPCIDRLEWTADGPRCIGPTWTPQPSPMAGGRA
jgi:beta-xylosidase